jgi:hypothetical protein
MSITIGLIQQQDADELGGFRLFVNRRASGCGRVERIAVRFPYE